MQRRYPGFLRPNVDPEVIMMICTSGHVDHGKTQLVKFLTGCSTARLKEEIERGMTIELGFAPCVIRGNETVGIVDVPGHEKFVKNMLAGVSGIGMTVLVVAADDGIMPQTVEHVQIMELLGVRHGMVALTKIDIVEPERVQAVTAEIRAALAGTFLADAPICPVSSETLDGFFEFYETLVARTDGIPRPTSFGVFRMPVVNAFASEGAGTIVTGIPVAGKVAIGDEVELVPGGATGRVRSIQRFLRDATEGGIGQCLALNIPDFGKVHPARGQVLCAPGCLKAATAFNVRLTTVRTLERPLRNAEEVKFHTGTSEISGKLYLVEGDALERGATGLATVVLNEAVGATLGDRCIVRRVSPAVTVGGGEVLGAYDGDSRPRRKWLGRQLQAQCAFFEGLSFHSPEGVERRVEYFLAAERKAGATDVDIAKGTLLRPDVVKGLLAALVAKKRIVLLASGTYVHVAAYDEFLKEVRARIEEALAKGTALSLTLSEVRKGMNLPPAFWARIEEDLAAEGAITRRGGKIVLEGAVSALSETERALMQRIVEVYEKEGFQSSRPEELPERLGAALPEIERLLEHLCNEGTLVRLSDKVVLSRRWLKDAQDKVVATVKAKGVLNSADFKYHLNSTRKYALAVLDWLDARRITVRIGNDRRLAPGYERNLL